MGYGRNIERKQP